MKRKKITAFLKMLKETIDDILMCFEGVKKPEGVEFMYNETLLEEHPDRRRKVSEVFAEIMKKRPDLIDVFGNQMHLQHTHAEEASHNPNDSIESVKSSLSLMKAIEDATFQLPDGTSKKVRTEIKPKIMKPRISHLIAAVILSALAYIPCSAQPIFTDASRSNRERAEDIVKHMTLREKVSLMVYDSPAVERLGIKKYNWWNEALHGIARNGNATVFPMPIAMASSFDAELLEQVFTATSDEGRIKWNIARSSNDDNMWYKGLSYWTPNINIFRDPRWGRGMETYGEDPYLTSQLGMAVVRGLQGDNKDGVIKALACAKHYAIHSGPESSRHSFDAVVSERDLWETYLPAFKDLITKADVKQVMFAYNRMFGVPAGANERFMRDILEKEWGFEGVVVSDCWAVADFYSGHKWSADKAEAAAAAVKAGMDMECGNAVPAIPEAIRRGLLTEMSMRVSQGSWSIVICSARWMRRFFGIIFHMNNYAQRSIAIWP